MSTPGPHQSAIAQAESPAVLRHRPLIAIYRSTREFLADLPGAERRFWLLVVATGAAAGLGAVLLVKLLSVIQAVAWPPGASLLESAQKAPWTQRLLIPTLAGVLVSIVAFLARRPLAGHGTSAIIEAIWVREGRYSLSRAGLNGLMAIVVVALGAPLGREGALIAFGAGFGSWLARRAKSPPDQTRILVACGAASGIAAAYNVPVGAALFGLEVLLGSFALELLGPIVVSCVVATAISRILVESHPAYVIPYYRLSSMSELLRFTLLAPVLGVASALFVRTAEKLAEWGARMPPRVMAFMPIVSMAAVGGVACFFPEILGNGYDAVNHALLNELPLRLLIVLPFLKLAMTTLCSASGVPGGMFTPSLFYGGLLGAALGTLLHHVAPTPTPAGAYALVGMAAVLSGTTHAAVSSVLILFEMTRDYGVILPLLLASVISVAVSQSLEKDSLYTGVLRRQGVKLPERPRPQWLRETSVETLLQREHAFVGRGAPFEETLHKLLALPPGRDVYVVDKDGRYEGAIVLDALKGHLPDRSALAFIVAADLMDTQLQPLRLDNSLATAAERFSETYVESLPVVDASGILTGIISKQLLLRQGQF